MTSQTGEPTQEVSGRQLLSGRLMLLEALIVLGFFGFYIYEMVTGATDDAVRAATSAALILIFGVFLGMVGRGWLRGSRWPRTPTILWNALLLPVAWSLHDAGRTALALGIGILALVTIWAALTSPAEPTRRGGDDEVS